MKAYHSRIIIGLAFIGVMFGLFAIADIATHKKCDCGTICGKQFSCGLISCPTGDRHE